MLEVIFGILMIIVFGKLIWWAIKAAWSITKVLFTIVFLPLVLIGIAVSGAIYLALIILVIGGVVAFVGSALA